MDRLLDSAQATKASPRAASRVEIGPACFSGFPDRSYVLWVEAFILPEQPYIALLFTTFPKSTETFLQREVAALQARGLPIKLFSLWGGGGDFRGMPVQGFPKWRLVPLILFQLPWYALTQPRLVRDLCEGVIRRSAPSWINFWENMLGAGFAGSYAAWFKKNPPRHIHGAWSGAPATAAWLWWRMFGWRYSVGAHAYDIYEHGGDWWLLEKLAHARFIHTSTDMARSELMARGVPAEKIICIRRGLDAFPEFKPLRPDRRCLRLVCIARLVEKKGLMHQLRIYAALKAAGASFAARIIGDGPMREELARTIEALDLKAEVELTGHLGQPEVWAQLAWADALLHTGIVAPSGDRDGLPNVIPEAMTAGVVVITSPAAATTEAIQEEVTGVVAEVTLPSAWVAALQRLATDDAWVEQLRGNARRWVEENYDAHRNTARLVACFEKAISS